MNTLAAQPPTEPKTIPVEFDTFREGEQIATDTALVRMGVSDAFALIFGGHTQ